MKRRDFLAALPLPLLGQHPVVNLDQHGDMDMPSGMDMASDNVIQTRATQSSGNGNRVLTRSGGNLRHGVYQDIILTPQRLIKQPPRKKFTIQLPGDARGLEAQPLIVPFVQMGDDVRDLVISATMGNQVYAHDANDGTPLWMCFLGNPVIGTTKIDGWRINQNWGVLSTPVVDGTNLYVVAWVSKDGTPANSHHTLFHIDIGTGRVVRLMPIPADKPTMQRKQRASLLLIGNKLYIPWGTIQETATGAHGFVTCVDVEHWSILNEWNATSTGSGAGIWMAGQGPATDGKFIYLMTGNGDYDGVHNFGECFVRLDASLHVVDHWSPFRDNQRSGGGYQDMDLGSGGCVYVPELNIVCGAGKDGILYVLRADNLKAGPIQPPIFFTFNGMGLDATPANVRDLDQFRNGKTVHMHSTPIYWDGKLYCWGENGNGRVWSISKNGKVDFIARTEETASPYTPPSPGGMPGSMLALSANGAKDGVLWAVVPDGDANRKVTTGRVFAFDAQKFTNRLQDGDLQISRLWMSDPHHIYNKFNVPVIWNGKVYVPTYGSSADNEGVGTIEVWG